MDKIYIVMNYVEHDLKSLMETMKQPFLPGGPGPTVLSVSPPGGLWAVSPRGPPCPPAALHRPWERWDRGWHRIPCGGVCMPSGGVPGGDRAGPLAPQGR